MWPRSFRAVYPQKLLAHLGCTRKPTRGRMWEGYRPLQRKLRIPVKTSDIDLVHRVGGPGTVPRQILVTFATYGTRTSVYKTKSVLLPGGRHPHSPWTLGGAAGVTSEPEAAKEPPPEDPTTDDDADDDYDEAGLDYSKIYISEDLTRQRQFIFWKCREAKKSKKMRDCWTTDGQIIIRDSANKVTPINSLNDLVKILSIRCECGICDICIFVCACDIHMHLRVYIYVRYSFHYIKPNLDQSIIILPLRDKYFNISMLTDIFWPFRIRNIITA